MNLANSVVHQQYARKADYKVIWDRLVSALPSAFVQVQLYTTLTPDSSIDFHLLQ